MNRHDVGFSLSHVPSERFEAFWSRVADALEPGGGVLFIDDAYRTSDELVCGASSSTIRRRLRDGTAYRAVKVAYDPADLEGRLARSSGEPARVLPPRTSTDSAAFTAQQRH